jgi:hypothetical protein
VENLYICIVGMFKLCVVCCGNKWKTYHAVALQSSKVLNGLFTKFESIKEISMNPNKTQSTPK